MQRGIWPLETSIIAFAVAAGVILWGGVKMAKLADRLADRLGLGEALFGGIFLGASTSLPGIVVSVTAGADGHADFAASNALGGIVAQTVFIAFADLFHPRVNLEHASASLANLVYGALLLLLLFIPMLAAQAPAVQLWGVHPASPLMLVAYGYGLFLVRESQTEPMWRPRHTRETKPDVPEPQEQGAPSTASLWLRFAPLAVMVAGCGWVLARAGTSISHHTGMSHTLVGVLLTGLTTSLPELVTAVAAVRQGSLTLAVGGIIGGNAFDVLFLAFADIAYRPGSLYHAISGQQLLLLTLAQAMTVVLLLGMLRREKHGLGNIGVEGLLLLVLYFGGMSLLFFTG